MAAVWEAAFAGKWFGSVQFAGGVCVEWGVAAIPLSDGAQADSASSAHSSSGRHLRAGCMVFATSEAGMGRDAPVFSI